MTADDRRPSGAVLALVPAKDEADRVGATVRALRRLPGVAEVLVVSDGSTDATAARALEAGAHCLTCPATSARAAPSTPASPP
ncbi:MAG TPA: glycosyltransferase [Actinomycetota bacterium]|nr:glycosyltransferase [Actinomycetota bacterium]